MNDLRPRHNDMLFHKRSYIFDANIQAWICVDDRFPPIVYIDVRVDWHDSKANRTMWIAKGK